MTTSGSTNWVLNRNEIISSALRKLRIINASGTAAGSDITTGAEALNALIKSWQVKPAGGVTLWFDSEVCLFLTKDAQSYTLGPTGGHCCLLSDAVATTLTATAAISATALTVVSNAGIAASDYLGVELDNGTLYWSTQSGAPGGSTGLTLASGVTSAASSGNYVFSYTTKITRPIEILEARTRDTSDSDMPLTIHEGRREFMAITDKTSSGLATDLYLSPTITNSTLYAWPVADDVQQRIVMTVRRVVEDFDSSTDNFDGPPEALRALIWNLAVELAPEYNKEVPQAVAAIAADTYNDLFNFYRKREPVYFSPRK